MNPDILDIQRLLVAKGFDPGQLDGIWGRNTAAAIRTALGRLPNVAVVPEIDDRAVDLVKQFEGFSAQAYLDKLADPPVWTIGYGVTARADVGIVPGIGMRITEAEGEVYLRLALEKFAAQIAPMIKRPITPVEFGAFLSLAYNIGPGAFSRSSALRHFNAGDKAAAANAILLWNKAGGKVLAGLKRRREAEKALFLS